MGAVARLSEGKTCTRAGETRVARICSGTVSGRDNGAGVKRRPQGHGCGRLKKIAAIRACHSGPYESRGAAKIRVDGDSREADLVRVADAAAIGIAKNDSAKVCPGSG